jgi:lipoprotein-releasing system permease protein
MNLGRFIPNKVQSGEKFTLSSTAIRFACLTIVAGIFTLILAFAILNGFKSYIRSIVYQYNGHFEITRFGNDQPVRLDSGIYQNHRQTFPEIDKIRAVSYVGGIIQHEEAVEGIVLKGYDSTGIADMNGQIIEGEPIKLGDERKVLISQTMADKLKLKVKDSFVANFFDGGIKYKKLQVIGIFKTNLSDFDDKLIISNIALVNDLFRWDESQAARLEVIMKPTVQIDEYHDNFRLMIGVEHELISAHDKYIHLFAWLKNLDQNVMVLIGILFVLVLFSIISTMYILVFEKNQMVGVLKTLGASDAQILSIFRNLGLRIGLLGMFLANILAVLVMFVQRKYQWIKLDPEHYYLNYVPVKIDWLNILIINGISFFVILFILTIPYFVIVKMRPIENLKFA